MDGPDPSRQAVCGKGPGASYHRGRHHEEFEKYFI